MSIDYTSGLSRLRLLGVTGIISFALLLCPHVAFAAQSAGFRSDQTYGSELTVQSSAIRPQASSNAIKNKKAQAAYKKTLAGLKRKEGFANYRFIDLTNDGVDEMIVSYWPSIYSFKNGKVVKVDMRDVASVDYEKAYKKKKVLVYAKPDHYGSSTYGYLKWNGKKFILMAVKYTPNASGKSSMGWSPYYWLKGKGQVSKKSVNAYVKKLVGNSKATKLGYATYKEY